VREGYKCWVSMCGAWRDELLLTFLYCGVGDAVDSPSFLSPELVFLSSTAVASATCKLSVVAMPAAAAATIALMPLRNLFVSTTVATFTIFSKKSSMSVGSKSRRSAGSSTPSLSSWMMKFFDLIFQEVMSAGSVAGVVAREAMKEGSWEGRKRGNFYKNFFMFFFCFFPKIQ
jgi:hypothetical protein